nr:MAG TPA: hypothetical protein [Caudoviricetes sp.]
MIWIKQATVDGAIAMENGGVANLGFPTSKTRRGRVVDGGAYVQPSRFKIMQED